MACTRPLNAYQTASGKVFFTPSRDSVFIQLPCGQCVGCRLARSREWAVRCMHEAFMYEENCFITLTYADQHLPFTENGLPTLKRDDLTLFLKRLRKRFNHKIRYFGCGEYGSKLARPHYHLVLFNHDFADKVLFKSGKFPLFVSGVLQELWPFGHSIVAGFSFESAAYTARYCVKKINGDKADAHYQDRVPEFSCMSLRPGIGYDFFIEYYDDIVNHDKVVSRGGRAQQPPRYYDKLLSGCDLELLQANKARRKANAKPLDPWRLADLDKFNLIKFNNMMRKYENG
ncbi:rolling circle replication-associated protein [Intestinirhabdus alba]|uniref:rolling circle replication-associated protein n=1 Tax=Intestinirhabdus alba TaxID=2899544 RepID=UPI001ADED196|nr:hypothetical protein [Intestinirhabdus alba]